MKNKIIILLATMFVLAFSSCSHAPTVVPPSWKGFNYKVKQATENGDTIQVDRGALKPGSQIKVYAVRKNPGVYVGKMYGTIFVRTTAFFDDGTSSVEVLDKSAIQMENASLDGWEDPYATFTLPDTDKSYVYYNVEAACQFSFKTFGNQDSEVDFSDQTSHEEPYLGHIYTDLTNFHTYNGGSANTGKVAGELKYHTIYTNY